MRQLVYMILVVLAVTMALRWLETQIFTHVGILSDFLSIFRWVEATFKDTGSSHYSYPQYTL